MIGLLPQQLLCFFSLVYSIVNERVHNEFIKPYSNESAIKATGLIVAVIIFLIFATVFCVSGLTESIDSLEDALNAIDARYGNSACIILGSIEIFNGYIECFRQYIIDIASSYYPTISTIIHVSIWAGSAISIASILGTCYLSRDDYLLVYRPIIETEKSQQTTTLRKPKMQYVAASCILPIVLIVGLFAANQEYCNMQSNEDFINAKKYINYQINQIAYKVDGSFYKKDAIQVIVDEFTKKSEQLSTEAKDSLISIVNEQCDQQIENVDSYLDWYYSLNADIDMLAGIFTGEIADGVEDQFKSYINSDIDISALETQYANYTNEITNLKDEMYKELDKYKLDGIPNWVTSDDNSIDIKLTDAVKPSQELLEGLERMGLSAGAGVISGVITEKAIAKAAEKGVTKLMAEKLTVALTKRGLIATAGGVSKIVSAIPTPQTKIGGLAVGTAVAVASDLLFQKADEALNRETYKQEIIDSINEARDEAIAQINSAYSETSKEN